MTAKNSTKSTIHENADANITCNFGGGDISRFRSRLPHIVSSIIVRLILLLGGAMRITNFNLKIDRAYMMRIHKKIGTHPYKLLKVLSYACCLLTLLCES